MKIKRKTLIIIAIIAFGLCIAVLLINPGVLDKLKVSSPGGSRDVDTSQLEIENYIFTKLGGMNKALIRVYGANKSKKVVSNFPVTIEYYSQQGELLGTDYCDLLAGFDAGDLNPEGKFNAQVNVVYPLNTHSIELEIKAD